MRKASLLQIDNMEQKSWALDVLSCVNAINKDFFTLNEIYAFETELLDKHPGNHNVKAKIRQQLQFLRNKGFIRFLDRGHYRKI